MNHNLRRLMVFGDSNAYRPSNGRSCWPAMLQRNSCNTIFVINESCDGRTTQYDTGECNGLAVIEKKIKYAKPLAFVLVALGTNDAKALYGPPDASGVIEGIHQIIQSISRCIRDAEIALVTPPPMGTVIHGELAGAQHRLLSVVAEIRRYATTRRVRFVDLHSVIDADSDLEADHVHLNAHGRKKTADAVWRCIRDHDRAPI